MNEPTTTQRLNALGFEAHRVNKYGVFKGMAVWRDGKPIHGPLTMHVDHAIAICNLLESGRPLLNDVQRCTGEGCRERSWCKRYLATFVDCGPVPTGDPPDDGIDNCCAMIELEVL